MKNRLPRKIRWSLGICSVLIAMSLIAASCTAAVTSTSTTTATPTSTLTTPTTPTTTTTTTTTTGPITTLPPTTTTNPAATTVLTVVNGNTSQNYTLAQLQALEATAAYGTTKNGTTITGPNDYIGVKFTTLLKASGGMTSSEALTITAQNGSTEDLSYAQVYQGTVNTYTLTGGTAAAGQQPLFMVIYSMNGNPLDVKTGPVETGIMTENDRASDASLWLPMTTQITIHPATRTVTDSTGAVVTIPWTVNRIADAWHANNEIVMLLGGASKLVATTTVVQGLPWFIKLDPAIATIPAPFTSTAGQVNMEMLIATNPDVLLCSAGSFTAATMSQFAAANIPVVQMPAATFADLQTTVNITSNCRYHTLVSVLNGKPLPDFTRVSIDTYPSDRLVFQRARCGGTGIPMIRVRPSADAGTEIRNRIKSGAVGQCMQCRNNGRCHCSQDGDHPERLIKLF